MSADIKTWRDRMTEFGSTEATATRSEITDLRAALAATIAPAQASQDERAAFEAWYAQSKERFVDLKPVNWIGWQARAQLAAQSAPQQAVPPKIEAWKYQTIVGGEWRVTLNESWAKCINEGSVIPLVAAPAADKAES